MPQFCVLDIEIYRPNWRVRRKRREMFDPARNRIITTGLSDGEQVLICPVIEDLKKEKEPVEFLITKLGEIECSTLVGYNILHFDIPYLVYKAGAIGKDTNLSQFKILDLFWVLPYWLHNVPSGKAFFKTVPHLGNLWKLERKGRFKYNLK